MRGITKWLTVSIAVFGAISPWFADFNETHIFNREWSPHAIFHSGQVLIFTSLASVCALYFLLAKHESERLAFIAGWMMASLYWFSLGAAILFPGTAWIDPAFRNDPSQYILGFPGNAVACSVIALALVSTGILGVRARPPKVMRKIRPDLTAHAGAHDRHR